MASAIQPWQVEGGSEGGGGVGGGEGGGEGGGGEGGGEGGGGEGGGEGGGGDGGAWTERISYAVIYSQQSKHA